MDPDRIAWLNQPTRRRMLEAAECCFAEVGYDLARVDDIAAAAAVSKSHLYYHFPGKVELLAGLIDLRTAELLAGKDDIFGGLSAQAVLSDTAVLAGVLRRAFTEILQPRRRFIRIVLTEALKGSEAIGPVFAMLDAMLDDTVARFDALGIRVDAQGVKLFFHFGIVPALFAVALDTERTGLTLDPDLAADLARLEQILIRALIRDDQ